MKYIINKKFNYRKYLKSVIIDNKITLNETAAFIFLYFEDTNSYEKMLEEFEKNYKVTDGFQDEVRKLFDQLVEKKYIIEAI
ncbi:PqqD family protein [Staphylococcus chromogenes]|uniref:PqqD family protein n=1 Tax=Staphylococcus chromogenes TaxID=46126 RepID=UPI002DBA460F|nr:PqqD family protein [Staphylococcus chromogenes]MEB7433231.1 PqqD family protein [Staphylococcus chromogenes]